VRCSPPVDDGGVSALMNPREVRVESDRRKEDECAR
jgi:hypothetical protein